MVVVHRLGFRLIEIDPAYDHEGIVGLDEGYLVGCVYAGVGYHCYFDDYEGNLAG